MEHGEEIGSGQRDRPFGPLHGFGPHGLLRDFVTREAVEKQLRSLQRPSLGYKVEALKQEQQRLLDERRMLEVEEARLLSPAQLEQLAHRHHLVTPKSEQLIDLDPKGEGSLASLQTKVR